MLIILKGHTHTTLLYIIIYMNKTITIYIYRTLRMTFFKGGVQASRLTLFPVFVLS